MIIQQNNLSSLNISGDQQIHHHLILRFFAQVISYIFHPVFIPAYITYFLVFIHPAYFVGIDPATKWSFFRSVVINMVFFPLVTVLLLKGVGFIDSVFLKTQKDRIIPYVTCGIFFFWMYLVFRNLQQVSTILTSFVFGVFITSSVALIANIYYKISMHALGVGGALGIMLLILFTNPSWSVSIPLMITILICGMVCTSRMIISNHTQKEIYVGLFFGVVCQFIASWFIF